MKNDIELRGLHRIPGKLPQISLEAGKTALMVIDVQYLDAHRQGEYGRRARTQGVEETLEYYFQQLENGALANMRRLLEAARAKDLVVVHTRIASHTKDCKDTSWRFKQFPLLCPKDSDDARFLPEVEPIPGEIVLEKCTASIFNSTNIDRLLRNMGIECLVVCGVVTNGCVESSIRDGADLGYRIILAEDACAALTQAAHMNALNAMHLSFAIAKCTDEILTQIRTEC